jgi:hypothetical protein
MTMAAQWQERVDEWKASGQSADAFASGKGFSGKTLRWWSCELGRRRREQKAPRPRRADVPKMARIVRTSPAPSPSQQDDSLHVEVGNARIVVRRGFDATFLREVVHALGGGR